MPSRFEFRSMERIQLHFKSAARNLVSVRVGEEEDPEGEGLRGGAVGGGNGSGGRVCGEGEGEGG